VPGHHKSLSCLCCPLTARSGSPPAPPHRPASWTQPLPLSKLGSGQLSSSSLHSLCMMGPPKGWRLQPLGAPKSQVTLTPLKVSALHKEESPNEPAHLSYSSSSSCPHCVKACGLQQAGRLCAFEPRGASTEIKEFTFDIRTRLSFVRF
jgi:hypothetical protein